MGKIVVSLSVSLDGVVQDPDDDAEDGEWLGRSPAGPEAAGPGLSPDGDVVVYGSLLLVRDLIRRHLVDELRLTILPVVMGSGERLFAGVEDLEPLRLIDSGVVGRGLAFLTYECARA